MKNFRKGQEVLITTFNPPEKATVADVYELPFEQVPMTDKEMIRKYRGKKVPIVEVFLNGKVRSFVSEVVVKA